MADTITLAETLEALEGTNVSFDLNENNKTLKINTKTPTIPLATNLNDGLMSKEDKAALENAISGGSAGFLQNTFTQVRANGKTVIATTPTTLLEFMPGNGISLNADNNSKRITITSNVANSSQSNSGLLSANDKIKLDTMTSGAEPNQNAFSTIKVGSTSINSTTKTDLFEIEAGTGITLTPSASLRKVTIAADFPVATTLAAGSMSATDKIKLNGIATNAEVNQNAYATIMVGSSLITATSKQDVLQIIAGSNINLIPDIANRKLTIESTLIASDGTVGTLMSAADKNKLDGIANGAQPNQIAYSNIKIGTSNITASSTTDTLELVPGEGILINSDNMNKKVTISHNFIAGNAIGFVIDPITKDVTINNLAAASSTPFNDADRIKLDSITANAEPNQNAFSNINANGTTISANTKTDLFNIMIATDSNLEMTVNQKTITLNTNAEVNQNAFSVITINNDPYLTTNAASKTDNFKLNFNPAQFAITKDANGTNISALGQIPSGMIAMWSGTIDTIPAGWAICNGDNGIPNLIDKFVKGSNMSGQTGGSDTISFRLNEDNIADHSHIIGYHNHYLFRGSLEENDDGSTEKPRQNIVRMRFTNLFANIFQFEPTDITQNANNGIPVFDSTINNSSAEISSKTNMGYNPTEDITYGINVNDYTSIELNNSVSYYSLIYIYKL